MYMHYVEFDIPEKFKDQAIEEFESKKAEEFFKWFMSIKDERVIIMEKFIQNAIGFETWKADYTSSSLNVLQKWFEPQIEERTISDEERDMQLKGLEGNKLYDYIKSQPRAVWTLTGETIRLSVDTGIYFSEVFIRNNPSLHWGQNTRSKYYIYRNYPLVRGFLSADFSPFFIVRNLITLYLRGEKFKWEDKYRERLQYIKK